MMEIRLLQKNERPPIEILMMAEPNQRVLQQKFRQSDCFVLLDESNFVGVYLLLPQEDHCLIDLLIIHPQLDKPGLEKDLLIHAKEATKEKGKSFVRVTTSNANIDHIEMLQKCGYRFYQIDTDFYVRTRNQTAVINDIPVVDQLIFQAKV